MHSILEFDVLRFMEQAKSVAGSLSDEAIHRISQEVETSLTKQFGTNSIRKFSLRMSNIGQPSCKLWYDKNKPEAALPNEPTFIVRMMLGDVLESIFRAMLREIGHEAAEPDSVELDLGNGRKIRGTPDVIIDGAVYDIKSCSRYAWDNKWCDYASLAKDDPFGYIGQLAGYAKAGGWKVGGWWVINKESGQIKLLSADEMDVDAEIAKLSNKYDEFHEDKFERQYEPVAETYKRKPSGNTKLCTTCEWCEYRGDCWPTLQIRESLVSQAAVKPMVPYVSIKEEEASD